MLSKRQDLSHKIDNVSLLDTRTWNWQWVLRPFAWYDNPSSAPAWDSASSWAAWSVVCSWPACKSQSGSHRPPELNPEYSSAAYRIIKYVTRYYSKTLFVGVLWWEQKITTSNSAYAAPGTVVKHKLYSCMILGYSELKSISSTSLS